MGNDYAPTWPVEVGRTSNFTTFGNTTLTSNTGGYGFQVTLGPDEDDGGAGVREPRRPKTPLAPAEVALSVV